MPQHVFDCGASKKVMVFSTINGVEQACKADLYSSLSPSLLSCSLPSQGVHLSQQHVLSFRCEGLRSNCLL